MKVIIDGFEEKYAVVELENRKVVDIPKELLPKGAKEGDVIEITINSQETKERKEKIEKLMKNLWAD
ncbi:DUF3006 domain-containing protein [Alkaliphilus transvaalensis]|uniref:DUF3006 domain-containing protein n=1 Tax=Alkaliphilus transvaalensis TaxID=114628 RepID=UPI00047A96E2|nr:DUF3006 domain-containing protein [Alkaliphilus transvaalensis]